MKNDFETKLTAYALGELDEFEKKEVEDLMAKDPQAKAFVEETRAFAGEIKTEFQKQNLNTLTREQHETLKSHLHPRKVFASSQWYAWGVAASVLLVAGLTLVLHSYAPNELAPPKPEEEVAQIETEVMQTETKDTNALPPEPAYAPKKMMAEAMDATSPSAPMVTGGGLSMLAGSASSVYPSAMPPSPIPAPQPFNTESYSHITDNTYQSVLQNPLSTFSIDVDTASYANVRRFLTQESLPPEDAVRTEELINYFTYSDAAPTGAEPFAAHIEVASSPWHEKYKLVRIGIKGKDIAKENRSPSNLVFLIDTSGSMMDENKLPLLKEAMKLLVDQLEEKDRVAIVTYAGSSGLSLPATTCDQKEKIKSAIDALESGGSTNGGAGIELAYQTVTTNFIKSGVNRVILATDGDFNVGTTSEGELTRLIQDKAKSGVFLSVLGFGMGNYKDSMMETLADKGNGNYAYIDTINEAKKALVEQMMGTLITIAKDVKIQVEFNPALVSAYRLIGYENRLLNKEDFNNDKIDAGEIGAGHNVTALYEIVPAGVDITLPGVDPLKYQKTQSATQPSASNTSELLTVKIRYKAPQGETSQLLEFPVQDSDQTLNQASTDMRFAAAVASFGLSLRNSPDKGNASLALAQDLASTSLGEDREGYRHEFLNLVQKARSLSQ